MEKNDLTGTGRCVVIGGSAGSLRALLEMIPMLRSSLPFPVIIVLHRKNDTRSGLQDLFATRTSLPVREAEDKDPLENGTLYLAPPDYHLLVEKDATIALDSSEKIRWSRPSIDVTFESVADVFGSGTMAILLSGANNDGAAGLKYVQDCGGITVVQDPDTAEIPVMPRSALEALRPDYLLAAAAIAGAINRF